MKYVKENQHPILSFPDTEVTFFSVDFQNKVAQIRCSDAYLDADTGGILLEGISVQIKNFSEIKISEYSCPEKIQLHMDCFEKSYSLKDICEFEYSKEHIILRGFSSGRGLWTEYIFFNADLSVGFDEEQPTQ